MQGGRGLSFHCRNTSALAAAASSPADGDAAAKPDAAENDGAGSKGEGDKVGMTLHALKLRPAESQAEFQDVVERRKAAMGGVAGGSADQPDADPWVPDV